MSSPIHILVYNFSGSTVKTSVTYSDSVQNNGSSMNNVNIPTNSVFDGFVTVSTGSSNGKLSFSLTNSANVVVASYQLLNLKDPENGESSITMTQVQGYVPTANGYRSLPGKNPDDRYIFCVVNQQP